MSNKLAQKLADMSNLCIRRQDDFIKSIKDGSLSLCSTLEYVEKAILDRTRAEAIQASIVEVNSWLADLRRYCIDKSNALRTADNFDDIDRARNDAMVSVYEDIIQYLERC